MSNDFIHLHTHSEHSMLDGLSRVEDIVVAAKNHGQKAVAITDHGSMGNVPELYRAAKKHDIKPILGCEFYITEDGAVRDQKNRFSHIVLLALDRKGYQLLCQFSAEAVDSFFFKPRLTHEIIRRHKKDLKHIVATTACLSGEIQKALRSGEGVNAKRIFQFYNSVFPNFFIELQRHYLPAGRILPDDTQELEFRREEKLVNNWLIKAANRYHTPVVVTNDSHYINPKDAKYHEYLLAIQTGANIKDEKRFHFNGEGYHIKSSEEMSRVFPSKLWKQSQKSMRWIYDHADIKLHELEEKKFFIPSAGFKDPDSELLSICRSNLKRRVDRRDRPQYLKQLDYELGVIRESGFANEFLIVRDYCTWAKRQGIVVGSGRGSMAGVLVSYLTDITDVDPIRFGLSFERALNPARPSLPDFDVDFNSRRIGEVFDYLRQKYGEENTMRIGTLGRFKPRSNLRGILKTLGYGFQESIGYTKQLPDTFEIVGAKVSRDLVKIFEDASPALAKLFKDDPRIPKLMLKYDDLIHTMGAHAGGLVISDKSKKLRKFMPSTKVNKDADIVTQFDKKDLEKFGFIKFDILSLSTLDVIADTIALVGEKIFSRNWPDGDALDDEKTFALINDQILTQVFQLDGYANRSAIKRIGGIFSFEDIVSISSIVRPGVAQFIPEFATNKIRAERGKRISYIHDELIPILQRTNGIILFQEQVMQIAQRLAGFNMIQVDDIKEMIKGKDHKKFTAMKPLFIEGCRENGIKKRYAKEIWILIEKASGYLYNRAHAVSYSLITYQTAYLKAHYPIEFMTACFNVADEDKKKELVRECAILGIEIKLASMKKSDVDCTIQKGKIRLGLSLVKGMGRLTSQRIVEARSQYGLRKGLKTLPARYYGARTIKLIDRMEANDVEPHLFEEVALYGFMVNDPVLPYAKKIRKDSSDDGTHTLFGGLVTKVKNHKDKNQNPMLFVTVSFDGVDQDIIVFASMMDVWSKILKEGSIVMVYGKKGTGRFKSIVPEQYEVLAEAS